MLTRFALLCAITLMAGSTLRIKEGEAEMNTMNEPSPTATTAGTYAEVNGINLYYEIHGIGKPLILLHGGLVSTESFGEVLPMLAQGRQVIAVDLQAHGRTADLDRPISYHFMADDIAALLEHLGIELRHLLFAQIGIHRYPLLGRADAQDRIKGHVATVK
jgi:hypothetical protein